MEMPRRFAIAQSSTLFVWCSVVIWGESFGGNEAELTFVLAYLFYLTPWVGVRDRLNVPCLCVLYNRHSTSSPVRLLLYIFHQVFFIAFEGYKHQQIVLTVQYVFFRVTLITKNRGFSLIKDEKTFVWFFCDKCHVYIFTYHPNVLSVNGDVQYFPWNVQNLFSIYPN
jgi:hypothetical protein